MSRPSHSIAALACVLAVLGFQGSSAAQDLDQLQKEAFEAAASGDLVALQDAVGQGADLEEEDVIYGDTMLNIAILKQHTDLVEWLLRQGADPNTRAGGWRTLHNALVREDHRTVKLLLEHGADVEMRDRHESTPLLWASKSIDTDLFLELLDYGADPNTINASGQTPLHLAAESELDEKVDLLLEYGADPNAQDDRQETPLHIVARMNRNPDKAMVLVAAGADREIVNLDGRTAFELLLSRPGADKDLLYVLNPDVEIKSPAAEHGAVVEPARPTNENVEVDR